MGQGHLAFLFYSENILVNLHKIISLGNDRAIDFDSNLPFCVGRDWFRLSSEGMKTGGIWGPQKCFFFLSFGIQHSDSTQLPQKNFSPDTAVAWQEIIFFPLFSENVPFGEEGHSTVSVLFQTRYGDDITHKLTIWQSARAKIMSNQDHTHSMSDRHTTHLNMAKQLSVKLVSCGKQSLCFVDIIGPVALSPDPVHFTGKYFPISCEQSSGDIHQDCFPQELWPTSSLSEDKKDL